jgi:hypothetical protein
MFDQLRLLRIVLGGRFRTQNSEGGIGKNCYMPFDP